MQKEHCADFVVLLYIVSLIIFVVFNIIKHISVLDIIYAITLVCCLLKLIINRRR